MARPIQVPDYLRHLRNLRIKLLCSGSCHRGDGSRKDAKGGRADAIGYLSWRLCVLSEAGVRTVSRIWVGWDWSHAKTRRPRSRLGVGWALTHNENKAAKGVKEFRREWLRRRLSLPSSARNKAIGPWCTAVVRGRGWAHAKTRNREDAKTRRREDAKWIAWDGIRSRGKRWVTPSDDVVETGSRERFPGTKGRGRLFFAAFAASRAA
jgi:hypothetical protein